MLNNVPGGCGEEKRHLAGPKNIGWIGKGMRFLTYYTDIRFLMDGAKNATRQLREIPAPKK